MLVKGLDLTDGFSHETWVYHVRLGSNMKTGPTFNK